MNIEELTARIDRTLARSGIDYPDDLPRTIAIDIDREESADVHVEYRDDGTVQYVKHGSSLLTGLTVYITGNTLMLPGGYDGEIDRDQLPPLLAVLNHIERTNIR